MSSDSVIGPSQARTTVISTVASGIPGGAAGKALRQLRQSLRAHSLFIALVVAYAGLGWLTPRLTSAPIPFSPHLYSTKLLLFVATFLVVCGTGYVAYVMIAVRPGQLVRYLVAAVRDRIVTLERVWVVLPVFLLLPIVMSTFTYFKFLIPYFRPYDLDPLFAQWDRNLHFGHDPWQLLQPMLGYPAASAFINFVYHLWLFVMFGVVLWQSFSVSRPRLRMRYIITFVMMWALLGNVAATVLSSAGPVYYGRITGLADPFAPLMAYLHHASQTVWLPALEVQELLWQANDDRHLDLGRGISAMPSMHVATSFSFALLGFAIKRWLGVVFSIFAGLILIGSVHLGWHYAIDGYAAIVGAGLIWWAVGWVLDRPAVARLLWGASPGRTA
jgi:PAP2 superfamily